MEPKRKISFEKKMSNYFLLRRYVYKKENFHGTKVAEFLTFAVVDKFIKRELIDKFYWILLNFWILQNLWKGRKHNSTFDPMHDWIQPIFFNVINMNY